METRETGSGRLWAQKGWSWVGRSDGDPAQLLPAIAVPRVVRGTDSPQPSLERDTTPTERAPTLPFQSTHPVGETHPYHTGIRARIEGTGGLW